MDTAGVSVLTPLHLAAQRLHLAAVRVLLGSKASPNAADRDGATPLHCVMASWEPFCKEACEAVATALLASGADPQLGNRKKETPMAMAAACGAAHMQLLFKRAIEVRQSGVLLVPGECVWGRLTSTGPCEHCD